jgi:hypothetical protein
MAGVITRYRGKQLSDKEVDRLLAEVEELSDKEAAQNSPMKARHRGKFAVKDRRTR